MLFVLGRGGVGKSTYAHSIGGPTATVISLDEIIRPWISPTDSYDDYAFNVYRPGGNARIQELRVRLASDVNDLCTDYTIVEGAIEDPELIPQLAGSRPYEVQFLRPASVDVFKQCMIKRVNAEYAAGQLRLGRVWDKLTPDELADYQVNGSDGELFGAFMDKLATDRYPFTAPTLDGVNYTLVEISW